MTAKIKQRGVSITALFTMPSALSEPLTGNEADVIKRHLEAAMAAATIELSQPGRQRRFELNYGNNFMVVNVVSKRDGDNGYNWFSESKEP